MSKSPAFQFYPADYLSDENVALMTLEEEGAYIRAMAYCWLHGSVPADLELFSRICKNCSNQCSTVVQRCFNQDVTDPSRLRHPRLDREREKQQEWRNKSSMAGVASAKARRDKRLANLTNVQPTLQIGCGLVQPKCNSSSSSSNKEINKEIDDPTLIARGILESCGLSQTNALFSAVLDQVKYAKAAGADLIAFAGTVTAAFLDYRGTVEFEKSPVNFFADATWKTQKSWKRLPNYHPKSKATEEWIPSHLLPSGPLKPVTQ